MNFCSLISRIFLKTVPIQLATCLLLACAATAGAQEVNYRFGNDVFQTLAEAEGAMRASFGDTGQYLEPLRIESSNGNQLHYYSVRMYSLPTEPFSWQTFFGTVDDGGSVPPCNLVADIVIPAIEHNCNSASEYTDRLEAVFAERNCSIPPPLVETRANLFAFSVGGGSVANPTVKSFFAQQRDVHISRVTGVGRYVGLFQSYYRGADCDDYFSVEPTQDCAPGTNCLPGPLLLQSLLGICPIGLVPRNVTRFAPNVFHHFPESCSADLQAVITAEFPGNATDDPVPQPNAPCVGNPCNVVSGGKTLREAIFQTPELSLELFYQSFATQVSDSRLGRAWRHSFDSMILETASGSSWDRSLILPNGQLSAFEEDPNQPGTFFPLAGGDSLLVSMSDTEIHYLPGTQEKWVYTNRAGGRRFFLSSIQDLDTGHALEINRNANWRVEGITTSSGRVLSFEYDEPNNRLASLSMDGVSVASFSFSTVPDQGNRLGGVTFADGSDRSYAYTDTRFPFHVTSITDERQNVLATYTYHGDGKAASSQQAGGAGRVELEYLPGQTRVDLPLGSERVYELSRPAGLGLTRLDRVVEGDLVTELVYDPQSPGVPTSRIDAKGHRIDYLYDARNRRTAVTRAAATAEAVTVETEWDDLHNRPSRTRFLDNTQAVIQEVTFVYDSAGQLVSRTESDPAPPQESRTTTFSYYQTPEVLEGRLFTVDGPRAGAGDTTVYTYRETTDPGGLYRAGDLHRVENAVGNAIEYLAFDAAGRPLQIQDPNGVLTTLEYHSRGWLVRSTTAGESFAYFYDATGNVERVTSPDGSFLAYEYDGAQRLVGVTDALGNSLAFTLDAAGNRVAEVNEDPSGGVRRSLSRVYDQLGLLRQLLHQGGATTLTYDETGQQTSVMDAVGRFSRFEYDALDRLTAAVDKISLLDERRSELAYDPFGNLASVEDPLSHSTLYGRNGFGDLLTVGSPDSGATQLTYDTAGNIVQRTDGRGETAVYAYDDSNRLTAIDYATGSAYDATFMYDEGLFGAGQLTRMTDASSGTTRWTYDAHGRVTSRIQTSPTGVVLTVQYQYSNGRLASISYPGGQRVAYGRNVAGQVTTMEVTTIGSKAPSTPILDSVEYLPFGPVSRIDYARSIFQDRLYDSDYRPTGFIGGLERSYTTNGTGQITEVSTAGQRFGYAYDSLGRLAESQKPPGEVTRSWTYDDNDNLVHDGNQAYQLDPDNNHFDTAFQTWFQYDGMGNLESISQARLGSRTMEYGPSQRLIHFGGSVGATSADYVYNGTGERVAKTTTSFSGGTVSTHFLYDEAGRLLGEYDENGNALKEYHWLDGLLVSLSSGGELFQVYTDHLGAPRAVRDSNDEVVWTWDDPLEPYGESLPDEDPDGDDTDFVLNLRFPGQYFDAESGFFYNYLRDYDPETGRYIESDPIGLGGGLNTYAYANADPLSFIDPLGLMNFRPFPDDGIGRFQNPVEEMFCRFFDFCPGDETEKLFDTGIPCETIRRVGISSAAGGIVGGLTGGFGGAARGAATPIAVEVLGFDPLNVFENTAFSTGVGGALERLDFDRRGGGAGARGAVTRGAGGGLLGGLAEAAVGEALDFVIPECPCP